MGGSLDDLNLTLSKVTKLLEGILTASCLEVTFEVSHHPGSIPQLVVEFSGPDASLFTARHGELLLAIEHVTAKVIGLDPEHHELLSVDANGFKKRRDRALRELAREAADRVKATSRPFTFAPMSSHERRLLHLALTTMGFRTASTGEGSQRAVVLYPESAGLNGSHSEHLDGHRRM